MARDNENTMNRHLPFSPFIARRRFVQGLAAAGVMSAFPSLWARAQAIPDFGVPVLSGNRFDLTVARLALNITGQPRTAVAVNGSVPGPALRMRQGDMVSINVTNHLDEPTSIHWHGILLPSAMDGVPGLSFRGIAPGETFTYRFQVNQAGTYWYHSHSGAQEGTGMFGAMLLIPRDKEPYAYDRDYVVHLSDWSDEDPMTIVSNLKQESDYYNFQQRTLGTFIDDVKETGFAATLKDRVMWGKMRMSPTDILDVSGATYTYLINGHPPVANWTALFSPGEKVRLRFINSAAMTLFDVRIPGLPLTVVAADGEDVDPVSIGEFRIGPGETYDIIVEPRDGAFTIFAQAQDRSGYARATLAPRPGMTAEVPAMDPRPMRTMQDMGMGSMAGMDMSGAGMADMNKAKSSASPDNAQNNGSGVDPATLAGQVNVDNVAAQPMDRLDEPGTGLEDNGRSVLVYTDLKALKQNADTRPPERDIVFHMTGNMERWTWGFDGKNFSEAPPVAVKLGERIRFVLINDTMMDHPMHLHGFQLTLENGQDEGSLPLKHTITVKPGERASFVFTADTPGHWAFHCHLLLHMDAGMFRTVVVS
jgi:CopA family copper-resistance protein